MFLSLRALVAFCAGFCIVLVAWAESSLLSNSPFLPPGYNVSSEPTQPQHQPASPTQVELRGIVKWEGQWRFSLYDAQNQRAVWVGLQESGSPYYVQAYDEQRRAITLQNNERTLQVPLKSSFEPIPIASSAQPMPTPPLRPEVISGATQGVEPPDADMRNREPLHQRRRIIRRRIIRR